MHNYGIKERFQSEILFKEDARCLPWSREEEKLASSKRGAFSKSAGQYLCSMMHEVIKGTIIRMVRVIQFSYFKAITKLSYSFPSLTPIS
jgi:hypothetical protein